MIGNLSVKSISKYLLAVISVVLLVFSAISCAYTPEDQYQNFLLDMDIITRYDLSIDSVQQNRATQYTIDELRTLIKDVESCEVDFADAHSANGNLVNCASKLIDSIKQSWDENPEAASESFDAAIDYYQEAKAIIRKNMGNTSV